MNKVKWYAAVLVVGSSIAGAPRSKSFIDFQIRLLTAKNAEAAYQEAMRLGVKEETSYKNALGEKVRWHFEGLHDLVELEEDRPQHGMEVYSLRAGNKAKALVVNKNQLTIFWLEAHKSKTVVEVLMDQK